MDFHHRPLLLGLNIAVVILFVVVIVFNLLSGQVGTGLFLSNQNNLTNKFYLEITPPGWAFSIWGLIYVWQVLWIVYSLTLVCRTGPQGPLYLNPVLLTIAFFCIYIVNLLLNIAWLFLFDREQLELSFVVLFLTVVSLYMGLWVSYRALEQSKFTLATQNRKIDDILVRTFVHNGLGIYAAWTSIATFLNMAFVIAYRSNPAISQSTASSIALAFIAVLLVAYAATDLTVFDKYTRYTITPYAVVIWALGASLAKNFDASKANSIVTAVLVGLGVVGLIAKIVVIIVRRRSRPIFFSGADITLQEKSPETP